MADWVGQLRLMADWVGQLRLMADWPGNETHGRLGGTICLGMYMTSYRLTLKCIKAE